MVIIIIYTQKKKKNQQLIIKCYDKRKKRKKYVIIILNVQKFANLSCCVEVRVKTLLTFRANTPSRPRRR